MIRWVTRTQTRSWEVARGPCSPCALRLWVLARCGMWGHTGSLLQGWAVVKGCECVICEVTPAQCRDRKVSRWFDSERCNNP